MIKNMFKEYVMGTYTRTGPVFVKGKGSYLWDEKGEKYLDFFPGWGVGILGHSHPAIARSLADQSKTLIHLPNNLFTPNQALCARALVKASGMKGAKVFFCNSGAESIEGALKLAKAYGNTKGRKEIIAMERSFHGRTMGALTVTVQGTKQKVFKPLMPGVRSVRFGDIESLRRKITSETAGIVLEPIQGEGGVNVPVKQYLNEVRELCHRHDIVLIFDEVQTGMARTGRMFAHQYFGVTPDVFTLSKGLGAGFPVGCFIASAEFSDVLGPGMHASTFGGSPLACSVVLAVLETIKRENVLRNVREKEKILYKRLNALKNKVKMIKVVRGVGLMYAVELDRSAKPVYDALMERKMITNVTQDKIMRIMPALNINDRDFEKGLNLLEEVFLDLDL